MRSRALVTLTQSHEQASQDGEVDGFAHFIGNIHAEIQRQIFCLLAQKTFLSADDDEMALEAKRLEMRQGFNSVYLRHAKIKRQHVGLHAAQNSVERARLHRSDGGGEAFKS